MACALVGHGAPLLEGTIDSMRPIAHGGLNVELVSGTNRSWIEVQNAGDTWPIPHSRLRVEKQNVPGWSHTQLLTGIMRPAARQVSDLEKIGATGQHAWCILDAAGQILAVSENGKFLAFRDNTGVILMEMPLGARAVQAGQMVHLAGNCVVEGNWAILRDPPLVDNDNIHAMTESSGTTYLAAGRHALRLDWFNGEYPYGVEVYYQGPELPRQKIPDSALFREEIRPGTGSVWTQGLDYRFYEGSWLRIPDFSALVPYKEGMSTNFSTAVATRLNEAGLEFKGYVEVARDGLYTFSTISDDGSLLFIDEKKPVIEVTGTNALPNPVLLSAQLPLREGGKTRWSQADGTVTFASQNSGKLELDLSSDTGPLHVQVADGAGTPLPLLLHRRIRIAGICVATHTAGGQMVAGTFFAPAISEMEFWEPEIQRWTDRLAPVQAGLDEMASHGSTNLPMLTSVEQIKRLSREQWQHGYPVKIRGIVTTVLEGGFFIQDSTWSIYARWRSPSDKDVPRIGDYWSVEGKTFAEFAPNIQVSRAVRLGAGSMPEPLHPTWDQLINGSLDTEYIEVQGIIVALHPDGITLLTRAGKLGLELPDLLSSELRQYDNALVRVRGCMIPVRDIQTQQVVPGRIRLSNTSITVDEIAPHDPFSTPLKHASDLLLFDWRAGAFQRVKIAGQILHHQDGIYFLADGKDGLRFIPKERLDFQPGDLVDAVGFLELGGASPILRETVARRTGQAKLPPPQTLDPDALLDRHYDSTLVKVRAKLIEVSHGFSEDTLEMQCGTHGFLARLKLRDGPLPDLLPGSLIELTGVYAGQSGNLASAQEITSFELLLNSPADIKMLKRPSWWTVPRALTVLGAMVMGFLVALIWIVLLRRRVEERSQQLSTEIREHDHTERRRELQEERTRIAHDLHDDLGAALTQIRFMSALESQDWRAPEGSRQRMCQISEKSREMVASLDEIVWAINPTNDSIASLANYLCHFAEEFFNSTAIRCRLDVADALPAAPLTSEVRHHLYLAVREASNNVAKHSGATEVWLRVHACEPELRIELEDNGRGFSERFASSGNGLANMRQRLEKIGGRFEIDSRLGTGAICRFVLQLNLASTSQAK